MLKSPHYDLNRHLGRCRFVNKRIWMGWGEVMRKHESG
jgi:hypothetical protein